MIFRYIISIFIIIAAHIATFAAWTDSGRKVLSECVNCSSLRQFPELLKKASELERIGRAGGNREEEIAGKSYRIRALIHLRDKSDLSNDIEYLKSLVDNQSSELADPNLAACKAVMNKNVYQLPSKAEAWDSPVPSGILGALWLANVLHSEALTDADCAAKIDEYYETFYDFTYSEN